MTGPSGEFIWCSGYSEEFTAATNALCLPRKECDSSQDNLGRVWKADEDFNILIKKTTPTETEDPLADDERIVYVTDTTLDCSDKVIPSYKDIARTGRVACEKECDDEGSSCKFFYVDYTDPESPECR